MSDNSPLNLSLSLGQKTVAVTGASSFTGLWICRAFENAGWNVHALVAGDLPEYGGLRKERVPQLFDVAKVHFKIRSEDGSMARWIEENPVDLWIHHHHWMLNFRSPDYDLHESKRVGIDPLSEIVKALKKSKCRGIVHSGTYFEPGEGGKKNTNENRTPYAESKGLVWSSLQIHCQREGIPLSKVVIPNPVGPWEDLDRIVPRLIIHSSQHPKGPFFLASPHSVRDYLPVKELVRLYVSAGELLLKGKNRILRPSGWVGPTDQWIIKVGLELFPKLGLKFPQVQAPLDEPGKSEYQNEDFIETLLDWDALWDDYAEWVGQFQSYWK